MTLPLFVLRCMMRDEKVEMVKTGVEKQFGRMENQHRETNEAAACLSPSCDSLSMTGGSLEIHLSAPSYNIT